MLCSVNFQMLTFILIYSCLVDRSVDCGRVTTIGRQFPLRRNGYKNYVPSRITSPAIRDLRRTLPKLKLSLNRNAQSSPLARFSSFSKLLFPFWSFSSFGRPFCPFRPCYSCPGNDNYGPIIDPDQISPYPVDDSLDSAIATNKKSNANQRYPTNQGDETATVDNQISFKTPNDKLNDRLTINGSKGNSTSQSTARERESRIDGGIRQLNLGQQAVRNGIKMANSSDNKY